MRDGLVFKHKIYICFLFISLPLTMKVASAQLDDPTRPPGYRLVLPSGKKIPSTNYFILSSVRISSSRRSAIINDRTVEVGENINGAKVLAIYPSTVKLKKQGKIFSVRLISRITKKARIN